MPNRYLRSFQQRTELFSAKWILAGAAIATSTAIFPATAIAQSESTPLPTTVCSYNPDGAPNPLGMRAFITVSEVEGDSIFVYEQLPSPVPGSSPTDSPATIARERTLVLADTAIAEARERVVNDSAYYAQLVGSTVEELDEDGFSQVNDTLTCRNITAANPPETPASGTPTPAAPPETPASGAPTPVTPPTPSAPPATPATTFADLPDGNYRVSSADLPFRVVEDQELLGSLVYLFSKTDDPVAGNFYSPETDISICVAGTIEGNVVNVFSQRTKVRITANI